MQDRSVRAGIGYQYPDHAVLPGRDEQFSIAAAADVEIGPVRRCAVGLFDQLRKRHVGPGAARVTDVELDLFDRRDGLRNAVVGFLQRGEIGREQPAALDVAEYEFAAQSLYAPVVGEASRNGLAFIEAQSERAQLT